MIDLSLLWGHPHSMYAHKSPKLDPFSPLVRNRTHLAWSPLCVRTFYIFTHFPPTNKFLFRFKFSSLTISRLFSFLLVSEVKFHWTNIKKISMITVHSLRLVYTFLYTTANGNVIASFIQKKKSFKILWSKKYFLCVRAQSWNSPSHLVRNRTHLAWPLPSTFVRRYYVNDHCHFRLKHSIFLQTF